MKKVYFSMFAMGMLLGLTGCTGPVSPEKPVEIKKVPHVIEDTKASVSGNYLGNLYKGNYVWGGAMNLAWNELNENIVHEKVQLNTQDQAALSMLDKLNNPVFTKNDLDAPSYYVKSGYGQQTVDLINKESREKFPQKSFSDLDLQLNPTDIISYAYFVKAVKYQDVFTKKDFDFNGEKVEGFYADNIQQSTNVQIIKYESDDKFIIKLRLKDNSDELILAKGYDMTNPQNAVDEVVANDKAWLPEMGERDNFEAPKLKLDYSRDYVEMINKYLANKGFENYYIAQMYENIKFDMDEAGAKVENEAVITMALGARVDEVKPKNLTLNKPYWIVMKRSDSQNPYFILGVNNTELMKRVQ
ncbi:MAG: hypothetical protein WCL61_02630 [bacterium]